MAFNLFRELIRLKRRNMTPAQRKRTKQISPTKTTWLYPFQFERKYQKFITDRMRQFSSRAVIELTNNLERWLDESKTDSIEPLNISESIKWNKYIENVNGRLVNSISINETKTDGEIRVDNYNTEWASFLSELIVLQGELFDLTGEGGGNTIAFLGTLGNQVNDFNRKQWGKWTEIAIGESFTTGELWVDDVLTSWETTNFDLLSDMTREYVKKLDVIVSNGVQTGALRADIMRDIKKMNKNMSLTRAKLLARDQIGKLNGYLTKRRQEDAGLSLYTWITAGDERVRSSHRKINGKICRWDNNNQYKNPGTASEVKKQKWKQRPGSWPHTIPGSEVQCRCSAIPWMNDLIEEVDQELEEEMRLAA